MTSILEPINSSTRGGLFWYRPAAWLRVTGPDAEAFLQGQFTNDLRLLSTQPAVYGLWLNVKGKVLADSFVLRDREPGTFWIGSYASPAAVIRERLESFIIADDVTIADETADWAAVSLIGPETISRFSPETVAEGFVFPGRRLPSDNFEWIYPVAAQLHVQARLAGFPELTQLTLDYRRIAAVIPSVPADIGPGDLPNEGGLEIDAISFTKGCYLGQEVMARLKSMGRVRRRLLRVRGAADAVPAVPASLFAGDRNVGELRSAIAEPVGGWIGLALLSLPNVTAGVALALAAGTTPTVDVVDAP
jgi:folate-binding protein YgfZ